MLWLFVAIQLLGQQQVPPVPAQPPAAPSAPVAADALPAGPPVYESAKGPIQLPNQCAAVDLESLGLVCSESDPCPTYLEISSTEANNDILLLGGNLHTTTNTIQSILLVSEDSGATWREAHPRIKAASLEGMQFLDFSHGWVAGHASLALPRDPFLLLTSDGGRTWRKSDFYAESRVGVVEDFAFRTTRNGWALIDNKGSGESGRYELFESQNGGSTWELREVSSRIPKAAVPGQRINSATTRTKADAKKNLITLERRSGAVWQPVASFRLRLEDCKPAPPQD